MRRGQVWKAKIYKAELIDIFDCQLLVSPQGMKSICEMLAQLFGKPRDPVAILPKKAMEKIFGFCRGNELLKFSLVNKSWFEFIAKSPTCMGKVRLHITEYFLHQKRSFNSADFLMLVEHRRNYTNLSIACIKSFPHKAQNFSPDHKLLMANYKWKSICLCNHHFNEDIDFIDFLGFVEPFVEELELRSVKIGLIVGAGDSNFLFPKLRSLRLVNVSNYIFSEPFKNVHRLREFVVATEPILPSYQDHTEEIKDRVKHIKKLFIKNARIVELEMFFEQKDFDEMFLDVNFSTRIAFRLTNLTVGRFRKLTKEGSNHFQLRNFLQFLQLHRESLDEVFIPDCLGNEVIEAVICQMVWLKILTVHDIEMQESSETSISNLKLTPNVTIESVNIWTRIHNSTDFIRNVLAHVPNLKHINIRIVNQPILNALAESSPHLESITADFFTAFLPANCQHFNNLKNLKIAIRSNDSYVEALENKENLTNFEKLFLQSSKSLRRKWNVNNRSFLKLNY